MSVSNQLISLASRELKECNIGLASITLVSNQLISLASREMQKSAK